MSRVLSKQWVRDLLLGLGLLAATLALMLHPQEAMEAGREGLTLCFTVIIPALFPFFVLSSLVVELGLAGYLGRLFEGIMRPLFRVSGACASALALGFIGGYPVGARTAIGLYQNGLCTKTEAERLLSFCNNSGPAFILGVVGAGVFGSGKAGLLLYLAHAAASLCVGLLFRFYKAGEVGKERAAPKIQAKRFTVAFTESVKGSFLSVLNICAFVVIFTVVIRLLTLSGLMPTAEGPRRLFIGLIELSSGVWSLSGAGELSGKLSMAAFMLGWAGVSVHCQVLSFIGGSGLSVRTYLAGKLLHGSISAGFTYVLFRVLPFSLPAAAYLTEQVDGLAALDFPTALTRSTVVAWIVFLCFLGAAVFVEALSRRAGEITTVRSKHR